jgi:hypothetical protein
MELTFEIICFQADAFLEPVIKSILPYGKIYAVEGPVRHWRDRGFTKSTDRTSEILHAYLPEDQIVHGQFEEKDEEVNAIADRIKSDFIFAVDADEVWSKNALDKIVSLLETGNVDSLAFKPYSFFGGFDRYMTGFEQNFPWQRVTRWNGRWATHRPPTVLAPDGRPWQEHRHLNQFQTDEMGIRFHHYSYCMPRQTYEKSLYYEREGGVIKDWFKEVYLKWTLGDMSHKVEVEQKHGGVHNWTPDRRGECFTTTFAGQHPEEIQKILPQLKERFDRELKEIMAEA